MSTPWHLFIIFINTHWKRCACPGDTYRFETCPIITPCMCILDTPFSTYCLEHYRQTTLLRYSWGFNVEITTHKLMMIKKLHAKFSNDEGNRKRKNIKCPAHCDIRAVRGILPRRIRNTEPIWRLQILFILKCLTAATACYCVYSHSNSLFWAYGNVANIYTVIE